MNISGASSRYPRCNGCGKLAHQIQEYVEAAKECGISPSLYVANEEGTYNPKNGHFLCTSCYVELGMPTSPKGWIAP